MSIGFHDLWVTYADDIYRFAVWMTGNPTRAEDIVSETFIQAWTSPTPKEAVTIKGYLLTIAKNLCLKARRRSLRYVSDDKLLLTTMVPRPDISEELAQAIALMQQLPEDERLALTLRAEDELSYEEIAAVLNITVGAAKVRVHRARQRLRQLREEERKEYRA